MSRPFHFKQFSIWQDKAAMKVGTDGVILGAWADVKGAKKILDIGTGTGLLAMMLAQRSEAEIDAVEIDEQAFLQAKENIEKGPWSDRINVYHQSIQDFFQFTDKKYDLIICNPPFFRNSLKAPDAARTTARHNDELPFSILLKVAAGLLAEDGKLVVILPADAADHFIEEAALNDLFPHKILKIIPAPGKPVKRKIIEFHIKKGPLKDKELIIESNGRHQYSDEFKALTKDFYLEK